MSFKVFLRDISNVSSARSVLLPMSPHSLNGNSPRISVETPNPLKSTSQYQIVEAEDEADKWDVYIRPSISGMCAAMGSFNGELGIAGASSTLRAPSRQLQCLLAPKHLNSSSSLMSRGSSRSSVRSCSSRLFNAVVLCSWRKRGERIKELSKHLEDLKRKVLKYDHRVHVYGKMYDNEKERNNELKNKLRQSKEALTVTQSNHDPLANALITLKAANSLLEQQLQMREEQFEGLQVAFTEVQSTLFKSMAKERDLQRQLCEKQRQVQSFVMREHELIAKLHESKKYADFKEQNLTDQLGLKQLTLARYEEDRDALLAAVTALLIKRSELDSLALKLKKTVDEVMAMKQSILCLRNQLENSWTNRIKRFWRQSSLCRRRIAEYVLIIGYCILPGMPVPKTCSIAFFPYHFSVC